jgi:hypothetical protein
VNNGIFDDLGMITNKEGSYNRVLQTETAKEEFMNVI